VIRIADSLNLCLLFGRELIESTDKLADAVVVAGIFDDRNQLIDVVGVGRRERNLVVERQ
jgi:hypothetical protein